MSFPYYLDLMFGSEQFVADSQVSKVLGKVVVKFDPFVHYQLNSLIHKNSSSKFYLKGNDKNDIKPSVYGSSDPFRVAKSYKLFDESENDVTEEYASASFGQMTEQYLISLGSSESDPGVQYVDIEWNEGYKYIVGVDYTSSEWRNIQLRKKSSGATGTKLIWYISNDTPVYYPYREDIQCIGTASAYTATFDKSNNEKIVIEEEDGLAVIYLSEEATSNYIQVSLLAVT